MTGSSNMKLILDTKKYVFIFGRSLTSLILLDFLKEKFVLGQIVVTEVKLQVQH